MTSLNPALVSRLRIALATLVFAVSYVVVAPVAFAQTVCEANTSQEIQDHLDDENCEVIEVAPGTYSPQDVVPSQDAFEVRRGVIILGPNTGINADDPGARAEEAIIESAEDGFQIHVFDEDEVVIDGFSIDVADDAIYSVLDEDTLAENADAETEDDGPGELVSDQSITVENNIILAGDLGVNVLDGSGLTVDGNTIDSVDDGVNVEDLDPDDGLNCPTTCTNAPDERDEEPDDSSDNTQRVLIEDLGAPGDSPEDTFIDVVPTRGEVDITDNVITAIADGVEIIHTSEVTVRENEFDVDEDAVHLRDVRGEDHLITNNEVDAAGDEAIFVEDTKATSNTEDRPVTPSSEVDDEEGIPDGEQCDDADTVDEEEDLCNPPPENTATGDSVKDIGVRAEGTFTISDNDIGESGAVGNDDSGDEENQDCEESGTGGILLCDLKGDRLLVTENQIDSTTGDGIQVQDTNFVEISNNTVGEMVDDGDFGECNDDPAAVGILVCNAMLVDAPIFRNTIGSGDTGIYLDETSAEDDIVGNPQRDWPPPDTDFTVDGDTDSEGDPSNPDEVDEPTPTVIRGNDLEGPYDNEGIGLLDTQVTEVRNNDVGDSSENGIEALDVKAIHVSGNDIGPASGDGIRLLDVQETTIRNNIVDSPNADGTFIDGAHDTTVSQNEISDAGNDGVHFTNVAGEVLIQRNLITNATAGAVHVSAQNFQQIQDETNASIIVEVIPTDILIEFNDLLDSGQGVHVDSTWDQTYEGDGDDTFEPDPAVAELEVHNNNIVGNDDGILHEGQFAPEGDANDGQNDDVDATDNWWGCAAGPDEDPPAEPDVPECDDAVALNDDAGETPPDEIFVDPWATAEIDTDAGVGAEEPDPEPDPDPDPDPGPGGGGGGGSNDCEDGRDNDNDGRIDEADAGCSGGNDDTEDSEGTGSPSPSPSGSGSPSPSPSDGEDPEGVPAACVDAPDGVNVVIGTTGNDTLRGTRGRDYICALAGNDTVKALGNDDLVLSGPGTDTVQGNRGADSIYGGSGDDTLTGGRGRDVIGGGSGNDLLRGRGGVDDIDGNKGNDRLRGGGGEDVLVGGPDRDSCRERSDDRSACETS